MNLVGFPLLLALQAMPPSGEGKVEQPAERVESESRPLDLSEDFRLVLASPDHSGRFAVCLGAVIGMLTPDPIKRAAAVADLEVRRDFVSKAFHERFGNAPTAVRTLDILDSDSATTCVSVPSASANDALAVVLESLRPTSITAQRWSGLVQRWRDHDGLAASDVDNALQRELQSLIWLGIPEAAASITRTLEQSLTVQAEQVARSTPARLQKAVVVAAGEYQPSTIEREIRENSLVRDFTRGRGHAQRTPPPISEPRVQNPRFTRERIESPDGHVWLFGWPITHLDAAHVSGVQVLAQLLERYLSEQTPLGKAGIVMCLFRTERRYGSFVVEVRSQSLDLESVEKWVWSGIDRLKNAQFDNAELSEAIEHVKARAKPDSVDLMHRAWSIASQSFVAKELGGRHDTSALRLPNLSRIARADLERSHSSEVFGEALPPRPRSKSKQGRPVQTNRRPGRIYAVQNGDSLQMIAHRFHVTVAEIIRENRLSHPDQIRPGTKIFVPQPSSSVRMPR